jgi:H+-transporting ATPase
MAQINQIQHPSSAAQPAAPAEAEVLSTLPLSDLQARLQTSAQGLSAAEAERRLGCYGYNELAEEHVNALKKLLASFWGPIPWMIEIAALLSALVQHWEDFAIILALLIVNAVVGFWEEYQAGNTIAALKARLALGARVRRDGAWRGVPARELVPGDVIRLRLGDIIPADARVLSGEPAQVDQSALTGESLPVTRAVGDILYSGAVLKQGEIDALVYATGTASYFGRTAHLVQTARTVSHFQRAVLKIGDYLILVALALVILILMVALFRGEALLTTLEFALVLLVAAIPVAMPTVLSVTMAVGARALAAKQAVVTRLASIEELAGMDVLCSDKTGTLTENRLTLGTPVCLEPSMDVDQVILAAALASRAEDADPIDLAVLGAVHDRGQLERFEITHFQPFDPVHKRTEATVRGPDGRGFRVSKGAPQVMLALATNAAQVRGEFERGVEAFAAKGFRALGVARSDTDPADPQQQWQLVGLLPLYDPPRADSKETIQAATDMGVTVKMVTGDQVAIAREIAREVGLGTNILDASLFERTTPHAMGQLAAAIEEADGFAQVFPEHKFHLVEVLQQRGHVVGMTGDGVNDAPALKKANAGIAVSGATDAARSAAAIVSLAPGLSVIVDAIKESRKVFQRMQSYAIYRITETLRVLLLVTLSIVIFNFYPVTPVMIVLLAILNDGAILSIAYDNVRYSREPETWNFSIVLGIATVLGLLGMTETFGLFYLAENVWHLPREVIQTLIYLKLSVSGHLTIFVTRTRGPFWSIPPARILLGAVVGTQLLATLITVYGVLMTPIGWGWALVVWGYALTWFLVEDRVKLLAYRVFDHRQRGLLG